MTKKVDLKLDQDTIFIDSIIPMDFTKNFGQLALEIKYTNGDTQMLTTKSENPNVYGTHEFETKEEYMGFIEKLKNDKLVFK